MVSAGSVLLVNFGCKLGDWMSCLGIGVYYGLILKSRVNRTLATVIDYSLQLAVALKVLKHR